MRNASGWKRYYFSDHLGTASLIARQDNTIQREARHYPFGAIRWESGNFPTEQDYDFTGQRLDSYIKLLEMGARWYDPVIGRWISPDSIVPDFSNPQSLNRLSYVNNRPLNFVDPSGHIGICFQGSPATGDADPEENSALRQLCDSDNFKNEFGRIYIKGNRQKFVVEALDMIKEAIAGNADEPVGILGYSWGGPAALELAELLNQEGISVDKLILIDSVNKGRDFRGVADNLSFLPGFNYPQTPTDIPENVQQAINLSAESPNWKATSYAIEFHIPSYIPVYGRGSTIRFNRGDINLKLHGQKRYENALNVEISANHATIMNINHGTTNPPKMNPETQRQIRGFLN